ncbi:MAG: hypothetical protein PETM_02925 [Petrimonas sp.]|uniref:RagB/SusD family nutrient uptake outer membrane protein n=1 Tax=Petrimonas sp. TaxID=2023866 RepID=UPI0030CBA29D
MKSKKNYLIILALLGLSMTACLDLDEEVFDRVDSSIYYQDESSVKSAVASIYGTGALSYIEYFWYLQEFSADQVAWRTWNGGLWGWDEAEKFVLSSHTWTPDSKIIRQTWETAWTTIGLCNTLIEDLESLDPANLRMSEEKMQTYIAEVRTLRAWAYYNIYEVWGGALPLNVSAGSEIPGSASTDFDEGSQIIFNFLIEELDASVDNLTKNSVNRMNQAVNRIIKARLLLNAELFIKQPMYDECALISQDILNNKYGDYSIADDYRTNFSIENVNSPEVIMAFSFEVGQLNGGWMRNMPFLPYNIWDYFGGTYNQSGWNCTILTPSFDNSGTVLPSGGTTSPKSFLEAPYNDKLGAVYERFDNRDIRKQNYMYDEGTSNYKGMFLKGEIKANYGKGDPLKADADRDGQNIVYVDQVGTFLGKGRELETVMSPRWGEATSGLRLVKYPIYPSSAGIDFQDIDEVEFRLAEVVYMLAECKMRTGDSNGAKELVNSVRQRYFSASDWTVVKDQPGPGFTEFDMDWMLSQWGLEFLSEGRRRRTDLRRFDKFTQGQWWFFGRVTEDGKEIPAIRDRKYEWFPLPSSALMVNPGLVQNPNYQ